MKSPTVLPEATLRCMSEADRASMGKAGMTAADCAARVEVKMEKELQKQIAGLLSRRSIWYSQSAMHKRSTGTIGTPDFLFSIKGRAVAFECKTATGKLSADQATAHDAMRANGWRLFVIRDYEAAREALSEVECSP